MGRDGKLEGPEISVVETREKLRPRERATAPWGCKPEWGRSPALRL